MTKMRVKKWPSATDDDTDLVGETPGKSWSRGARNGKSRAAAWRAYRGRCHSYMTLTV